MVEHGAGNEEWEKHLQTPSSLTSEEQAPQLEELLAKALWVQ